MPKKFLNGGVILALFLGFLIPLVSFSQNSVEVPQTLDEAKEVGGQIIETTEKELPGTIERIWKEEVLPVWGKIFDWTRKEIWDSRMLPWFKGIGQKVKEIFLGEVDRRKPQVQEDFQQEKQELKQEAPVVTKSLWEKFMELIK